MLFWAILAIVMISLAVLATIGAIYLYQARQELRLPKEELAKEYSFAQPFAGPVFNRFDPSLKGQSPEWRQAMSKLGEIYAAKGIKTVICVHGTFVGEDPFGVVGFLGSRLAFAPHLRTIVKKTADRVLHDTGNFTSSYIQLTAEALGGHLSLRDFTWSSENHHAARLKAMVALVHKLAQQEKGGVLLLGHSHAGQIFALLEHCRTGSELGRKLSELIAAELRDEAFAQDLAAIRGESLYYVTLGTPPRYPWPSQPRPKLLNIVNHRGDTLAIAHGRGLLLDRSGDFIQHHGVAGSDLQSYSSAERRLNRALDPILGPGSNIPYWRQITRQPQRPLNPGHSILMEFHNQTRHRAEAIRSFLGHGCYTRFDHMLCLHEMIVGHFFKLRES